MEEEKKLAVGKRDFTEKFLWLVISNNPFGFTFMNLCSNGLASDSETEFSVFHTMTQFYLYLEKMLVCVLT